MRGNWREMKDEELWDRLLGDAPFIIFVILVVGGAGYFLVEEFRGQSRVNRAAVARCVQRGNTPDECRQRVEDHASLCYRLCMKNVSRGLSSSGETLDTQAYDRCLKYGKDKYLEKVAEESRKRIRKEQKMQEKYGLPP